MKQQEYQEALNDIVDNGVSIEYFNKQAIKEESDNSILIIQQLIDKLPYWLELEERDKPRKPTHIENNRYSCGNCFMSFTIPKVRFVNNQFCGVCGKRLDWSDEE